MTNTAAKVEKCESQHRSFQDVIQFDDENNVTICGKEILLWLQ